MNLILQTQRLVIKKPELKDKQPIIEALNNWEVVKWLVRVPYPYTAEDANHWITHLTKDNYAFNIYLDSKLIGGIGLSQENEHSDYVLGYWLAEEHWGKGYTTEACTKIISYAVQDLKITKIKSAYLIDNDRSAKVLKKLGFQEIGKSSKYSLSKKKEVEDIELELDLS
jgi:RimJ/RimL family protein N-acetyltransferase|tara:strand:+ start:276 stop:782 length:507 start_codon:yes stop_codon:yes gene_type:complete